MPAPDAARTAASSASTWPAILTWRANDVPRMESVRVQLSGSRVKASGRIVGAACADHPAFSASYDLVTDENGVTRRLSVRTTLASGEKHMSISRSGEGIWMVDNGTQHQRSAFGGALDVDVILSPFFNALPIRRYGLQSDADDLEVPVVYVNLLDLRVEEATLIYSSAADGIHVLSPVSSSTVTVDEDGFVLDYQGLAERI
ncbi:putative glycolipid-binding domain-containing protein [Rhodococcus zopfii]|uniref:Glycolipid-binding domain-containing protein n=1 Tax=Rhodococcus zopfii TaxID=43772 RepID=A0ABU3WUD9_9NOCA|nr:putative glycolipid-binding domain-containing protein [Rhodococcus zopfii]MDV2477621.1 putative glycolipid-binding domain-containing protein [Rhodococcus zopfii]